MSKAVAIINEIPANKAGIKIFADALVDASINGEIDPLDMRKRLDAIEKVIKEVKANKDFRDMILDAAALWPEKTFEHEGVKFTKAESAKYDYSADPVWNRLNSDVQRFTSSRKDEEQILAALKEPTEINGEMRFPPLKNSTSYVKVTF